MKKLFNNDNFYSGLLIAAASYVILLALCYGIRYLLLEAQWGPAFHFTFLKMSLTSIIPAIIFWQQSMRRNRYLQSRGLILFILIIIIVSFISFM